MIKIAVAAALSALVAYGAVAPSGAPETPSVQQPQRANKGDRLRVMPSNAACSDVGWPYYRDECVRRPQPINQAPARSDVRIVTADRFSNNRDRRLAATKAQSTNRSIRL